MFAAEAFGREGVGGGAESLQAERRQGGRAAPDKRGADADLLGEVVPGVGREFLKGRAFAHLHCELSVDVGIGRRAEEVVERREVDAAGEVEEAVVLAVGVSVAGEHVEDGGVDEA